MLEAQKRGYKLYHYIVDDLFLVNGELKVKMQEILLFPKQKTFFKLSEYVTLLAKELDIIFIRQDPPFNMNYITNTYLLDKISQEVFLINHPQSIRNYSEKLFACDFATYMPETLVANNVRVIEDFAANFEEIIIKPLYACGGEGVSKHQAPFLQLAHSIKKLQLAHQAPIMAQRYLPEIKQGDLRVLICCNKVVGQVLRVPQNDNIAANFHAGGLAKKAALTKIQQKIIKKLAPILLAKKLYFVGLDFIGDYLTEINVTSPTGIQEINQLNNVNISKDIWDLILVQYQKFLA
jgi:glutathione synthase